MREICEGADHAGRIRSGQLLEYTRKLTSGAFICIASKADANTTDAFDDVVDGLAVLIAHRFSKYAPRCRSADPCRGPGCRQDFPRTPPASPSSTPQVECSFRPGWRTCDSLPDRGRVQSVLVAHRRCRPAADETAYHRLSCAGERKGEGPSCPRFYPEMQDPGTFTRALASPGFLTEGNARCGCYHRIVRHRVWCDRWLKAHLRIRPTRCDSGSKTP